jgi:hypothetical protein
MLLGWVDFSQEARKRAFEALNALEEKGAVDELGIGTLRDAFADAMFPGTSTLQRRAKYFTLVPCCIRYALENTKGPILEELRTIEKKCCFLMGTACNGEGIIGWRNRHRQDWIQRTPTEIYWAGMRKMGILRTRMPPSLWIAHAARLATEAGPKSERKSGEGIDDDPETCFSGWKGEVNWRVWKDLYPDFLESWNTQTLPPDLTPKEATFLHDSILHSEETRGTLFAWCLEHGRIPKVHDFLDDDTPSMESHSPFYSFAKSIRHSVPQEMGALLDAANACNRLVFPARVLHNKLLAVPGIDATRIWKNMENDVPKWAETVDLESIFSLFPGRVPNSLDSFLRKLQRAFIEGDFTNAERLVRAREIFIKRARAKVLHPEKLKPDTWVGGGWLDYRLPNAGRILRDIAEKMP